MDVFLTRLARQGAFIAVAALSTSAANADLFFSTGNPDGRMATASRPGASGVSEIETADDFVLGQSTRLTSATFTGLIPVGASVTSVGVEIYRIFPKDSDVTRTSGAPTFGTSLVPTRVNSPSDVALDGRASDLGTLSFVTALLSSSFTVANSVLPGGIHPIPNQATGGNGAVTGQEVRFELNFIVPIDLAADHYFFVPQVGISGGGAFLWLSAPKPIVPPGTPFAPDLQTWTRDEFLDPDWLRVGTDIVGGSPAPTFDAAFSLSGEIIAETTVPEPGSLALTGLGALLLCLLGRWGHSASPTPCRRIEE